MTAKIGVWSAMKNVAFAVADSGTSRNRASSAIVVMPGVSTASRSSGASVGGAPRANSARSWFAA